MICVYYRLRFVTILLRIVAQSRAVQNAAQIYLAPGRHPVINAIAPELALWYAHILTEPLPENLDALLQQLDAKLSAASKLSRGCPANGYVGRVNAISHKGQYIYGTPSRQD
jgi:hypothetical protein